LFSTFLKKLTALPKWQISGTLVNTNFHVDHKKDGRLRRLTYESENLHPNR